MNVPTPGSEPQNRQGGSVMIPNLPVGYDTAMARKRRRAWRGTYLQTVCIRTRATAGIATACNAQSESDKSEKRPRVQTRAVSGA